MTPVFNIMALPLELFLAILVHAMHIRGLKRAMRLRLVNRHFDDQIMKILRQTRFLESYDVQLHKLGKIGTDFMTWRLLRVFPVNPLWEEVRHLARNLTKYGGNGEWSFKANISLMSRKINRTPHLTIRQLCDQTKLRSIGPPGLLENDALRLEHDFVRSAIYSGDLSIVEILSASTRLQDLWREDGHTFCELCIAGAETNNLRAMEAILDQLDVRHASIWRACYLTYFSLKGDITNFEKIVLLFQPETPPNRYPVLESILRTFNVELLQWWRDRFMSHQHQRRLPCILMLLYGLEEQRAFQAFEPSDHEQELVINILMHTPSPCIFDRLRTIRAQLTTSVMKQSLWIELLENACQNDWRNMVQYLLRQEPYILKPQMQTPLRLACSRGHTKAVQLLLKEGAVIDRETITATARAGYWSLVKMLVDEYGACNSMPLGVFMWAVIQERTTDYLELIKRHGILAFGDWQGIITRVEDAGLTGMVDLLKETHPAYTMVRSEPVEAATPSSANGNKRANIFETVAQLPSSRSYDASYKPFIGS